MTSALRTTVTRLMGADIEHLFELDTNNELNLSDTDRAELTRKAAGDYQAAADAILAPYGCVLLSDGGIFVKDINDEDVLGWDEEAVREALGMIDISAVQEDFES